MTEKPARPERESTVDREELFELVVESASDFAILTTDQEGFVTSWNIGCEKLTGFMEHEIIGQSADLIFVVEDCEAGVPEGERAAATSDGRAEDERWHRRKDASVFWGSGLMMPLRSGSGFVKIMRDLTERHLTEERLAASEERFRTLATTIPQLVFRTHDDGARSWGSPQWEVYTGLSNGASREFGWVEAIHPDDREHTIKAWDAARKDGLYSVEHRICSHADGQYRWYQTRAAPMPKGAGKDGEWVGTSTDIDELRRLQDRQHVLVAELQHRTRNLLALVQAMARKTLRTTASPAAFTSEFEGRLTALSRVQNLTSSSSEARVPLRALLETELQAHCGPGHNEVHIEGPQVELDSTAAQTLALAIHELATNAVKYGAIGQPAGKLSLTWRVDEPTARLILDWRESGVTMPDPSAPQRRGYGRELIERALPSQLGAETEFTIGADGVHCIIAVPLPAGEAPDLPG